MPCSEIFRTQDGVCQYSTDCTKKWCQPLVNTNLISKFQENVSSFNFLANALIILDELFDHHPGIMKSLARSDVWWPSVDTLIGHSKKLKCMSNAWINVLQSANSFMNPEAPGVR